MADIFDMTKTELQEFLITRGMKKFRADQIFHYIYKQHIFSWDDMVLLPKGDREKLKAELPIYFPEILAGQRVTVRYQSGTDRMSRTMTRVEGRTMNSAGPMAEGEPLCQS